MCVYKNISSMGSLSQNNSLTERRMTPSGATMSIKDIIQEKGVIARSVCYKVTNKGTRVNFYLQIENNFSILVNEDIWHKFNELPVLIEENKKIINLSK